MRFVKVHLVIIFALFGMVSTPLLAANKLSELEREFIYRVTLGNADDVLHLINELNANPDTRNEEGWTALTLAAERYDDKGLSIVNALLDANVDPDEAGDGPYPLITAIVNENIPVIQALLTRNADVTVKNKKGLTAEQIAREKGNKVIVGLIELVKGRDYFRNNISRNQKGLDRLMMDLAFHNCTYQYWRYVYRTQIEDIPKPQQRSTLQTHGYAINRIETQLKQAFSIHEDNLEIAGRKAAQVIFEELEAMISPRFRRQKGVGKEEDAQSRCRAVAKQFKGAVRLVNNAQ